jgi:hypothetical protein
MLAITEVSKMANQFYLGELKFDSYEKIQKFIAACEKDRKIGNTLSEKEETACTQMQNGEILGKTSYNNYIRACAFRKMAKEAKNIDNAYYNQKLVDLLAKDSKLNLINSKAPEDIQQLDYYVNKITNEFQEKLLPKFEQNCKTLIGYESFYNQHLIKGKTLPDFS